MGAADAATRTHQQIQKMRRNFATTTPAASSPSKTPIGAPLPVPESGALPVEGEVFALPVEAAAPPSSPTMDVGGKAFDAAVKRGGGHFVTVKPTPDTYMPVYYSHGKSYAGRVHHDKHPHKRKHSGAAVPVPDYSSSSDDDE